MHNVEKKQKSVRRKIEYIPPKLLEVDRYAYEVCRALEGEKDPNYRNTQTVQGFAAFMRVVVNITTKRLNQRNGIWLPKSTRSAK